MTIMRDHLGHNDYGLGQLPVGAQVGIRVASTAANFIPVVGPVISGIMSLFSSLFGGGPSRHQLSDAAIEAAKKYLPKDLPDMIRRIELFIKSTTNAKTGKTTCGIATVSPDFGGHGGAGTEGRGQYIAACVTAKHLGMLSADKSWAACPPYDAKWCYRIIDIHNFFVSVLPSLKQGIIPSKTSPLTATSTTTTPIVASLFDSSSLMPLILLGGGIYLLARR